VYNRQLHHHHVTGDDVSEEGEGQGRVQGQTEGDETSGHDGTTVTDRHGMIPFCVSSFVMFSQHC